MGESWTHKTWFCVTKIKEIFTNYSMTTNLRHDLVPRLRLVCLGQRSSSLFQNTKTLSKLGVTKSESEFIKSKTWQNETSFCSDHNSALSSALLQYLLIVVLLCKYVKNINLPFQISLCSQALPKTGINQRSCRLSRTNKAFVSTI